MKKFNQVKQFLLLCFLFAGMAASAQNNVIKAGLTGALIGDYNLGIEKKITGKSSLHLKAGYLDPTSSPLFSEEKFLPDDFEMMEVSGGLSTSLEYRFYLGKKEGLRGFYIAPYVRYFNQSMVFEDEIVISEQGYEQAFDFTVDGELNTFGTGIQLGYQWIFNDVFTLDLFFLGSGIDFHKAEATYSMDSKPDGFSYSMITPYVDEVFSDIKFLHKNITHEARSDSHYSQMPVKLPGFRAGISVGVAF